MSENRTFMRLTFAEDVSMVVFLELIDNLDISYKTSGTNNIILSFSDIQFLIPSLKEYNIISLSEVDKVGLYYSSSEYITPDWFYTSPQLILKSPYASIYYNWENDCIHYEKIDKDTKTKEEFTVPLHQLTYSLIDKSNSVYGLEANYIDFFKIMNRRGYLNLMREGLEDIWKDWKDYYDSIIPF